jgi:patatin-like phospholipase/acyl hydrolase
MNGTSENGAQRPMPFRVLALDGGGIKGTYTASVLASLEEMTGKRIVEHFDLITGTSTGGIIAVGLGLGLPAKEIRAFYVEKGPVIFPQPPSGFIRAAWRWAFGPKLSQDKLSAAVREVIGERLLGESRCRLVIPAYDGVRGSIHLFKTAHTPEYKQDYLRPALAVAMGTAAAPTYYPAYTDEAGGAYLDGGVWANSPVIVGLLEATCILRRKIDEVEILSIGTTTEPFDVSHARRRGGLLAWNKGLITLFMQAQAEAALGQARLLTNGRMLRIDATTTPGRFALDKATEINDLRSLGDQAARQHEKEISRRFLFAPAEPFTPLYPVGQSAPTERATAR